MSPEDHLRQEGAQAERAIWIEAMHDHIAFWKRSFENMTEAEQKHFEPLIMARLDSVKMVEHRADAIRNARNAEKRRRQTIARSRRSIQKE